MCTTHGSFSIDRNEDLREIGDRMEELRDAVDFL